MRGLPRPPRSSRASKTDTACRTKWPRVGSSAPAQARGSALGPGPAHHRNKADLVVRVVPEAAGELRGDGRGAGLFDPAHRHAHVLGLEHDRNAPGIEDFLDR